MSGGAWKSTVLADLIEDTIGGLWGSPPESAKLDETDVLVVRGADFRNWRDRRASDAAPRRVPIRSLERRRLEPGDLVLEVSGGSPAQPVGRVLVIDEHAIAEAAMPLICSNFCRKLRLKPGVDPFFVKRQLDWLYHSGHTDRFQTSTTNIRNLQVDDFVRGTEVVLPGRELQARVTALLEEIDHKSASGSSHVAAAMRAVERFRQAVLSAACSGALTRDWRSENPTADATSLVSELEKARSEILGPRAKPPVPITEVRLPEIPTTWQWLSVDALARKVADGVHKTPTYVDEGVPFITVRNLTAGNGISFDSVRYITELAHAEYIKRTHPEPGDILISKDGTIGVTRAVRTDRPFSIFVSVAIVKPLIYPMSDYLELALSSPPVQRQMVGVGSGLQHLVLRDLKADGVPVPPIEEQVEIARRVDQLMSLADRLESRIQTASHRIDRSSQAVLAKAFRGALVPAGVDP